MENLWVLIRDDLPALQIAVPLLAATMCILVRRPMAAWTVACGGMDACGGFPVDCNLLA